MEAPLAVAAALDAVASITPGGLPVEVAGLVALVADVQVLRNRLDGLVNDVLVAVARVDDAAMRAEFPDEEFSANFIGRVAEHSQAPELVAPCLGVSVHVAENRVLTALDLAERAPLLVAEMRAGRLEAFRAGLLHAELSDAPAAIEEEIVTRLVARADRVGGWAETAGPLLRRTRSLLARLAPQVLAARVEASRERRGLHKRGETESLDRWDGLYHVEDSRMAWAAIDDLAQHILTSGAADTLAQARADAHMQLLLDHCNVTVHLHATATAEQLAEQIAAQSTAASPATTPAPAANRRSAAPVRSATPSASTPEAEAEPPPTDDWAAADEPEWTPATEWAAEPTLDAGPGPAPAGDWASAAHEPECPPATEWPAEPTLETEPEPAARPAQASEPAADAERAGAPVVEVGGFDGPGTMLVRRDWLDDALAAGRAVLDAPVRCHPSTGAILDGAIAKGFTRANTRPVSGDDSDPRYRIPEPMARLVRFRDRQCRFPGCAISSRFCDLDHVTPWPDGPTSPANLMALCRRHHRLKQTPGWQVEIHPDLTVTWTDPIGRAHTSYPSDHLGLDDDWRRLPSADSTALGPSEAADSDFSPLEAHLTRLLAA